MRKQNLKSNILNYFTNGNIISIYSNFIIFYMIDPLHNQAQSQKMNSNIDHQKMHCIYSARTQSKQYKKQRRQSYYPSPVFPLQLHTVVFVTAKVQVIGQYASQYPAICCGGLQTKKQGWLQRQACALCTFSGKRKMQLNTIMETDKVQCQQSNMETEPVKQCQHQGDGFVLTVNLTGSI